MAIPCVYWVGTLRAFKLCRNQTSAQTRYNYREFTTKQTQKGVSIEIQT
jgi:hypothetical protein